MSRGPDGYDLIREGAIVREQLAAKVDPVVRARKMLSEALLAQTLLALSDAGFYEYVSAHPEFETQAAVDALGLDAFVFDGLLEHLIGWGLLSREDGRLRVTDDGRVYFNVYTRGVVNIYLGGYAPILNRLSDALQGKVALDDPSLARSTRHAAAGTAFATCGFTVPSVFEAIRDTGARCCLDLGCGTGDFLVQFLRMYDDARAVGVDMSGAALDQARDTAKAFSVDDRITFHLAEVGPNPLAIEKEVLDSVDIVTSMYMLHEFGRHGEQAIIDVIAALGRQLPGRLLLMLEVVAVDVDAHAKERQPHYGRLDYRLIHVLSGQGLPRSQSSWHEILRAAGCEIVNPGIRTGGSNIYIARFPGQAR